MTVVERGSPDAPAAVRAYWVLDGLVVIHAAGEETDGRYCLVEWLVPPGDMTPLHIHRFDSQLLYVIEGELTIHEPDGKYVLRSGQSRRTPACVVHTEHNTSDGPTRVLDINSPAGFDRFLVEVGRRADALELPPPLDAPQDVDALIAVAAKHGIDVLGPPGALP